MNCSDRTRRSLSAALGSGEVTEEALAFVAGKTQSTVDRASLANGPMVATTPRVPIPTQSTSESSVPNGVSEFASDACVGTASITVRLPGSLPPRLLRASLERKLRRQTPFTQQEIVTEALTRWLKEHGYQS